MKIRVLVKAFFVFALMVFSLDALSTAVFTWPAAPTATEILADAAFQTDVASEWAASRSGDKAQRHEEGGWIVQCRTLNLSTQEYDLSYRVDGVPSGVKDGIAPGVPPVVGDDCRIIGFKHTHPNPPTDEDGTKWDQGPSKADEGWHTRHGIPGIIVNAGGTASFGPANGTYQ